MKLASPFAASALWALAASTAVAADPAAPLSVHAESGNAAAVALSARSPMVASARAFLLRRAQGITSAKLRAATLDALENPGTCIAHRAGVDEAKKTAILAALTAAGLIDPADEARFPGGLRAGVFPPVKGDGSACPKLPQSFFSAPGSSFGGHHSYPGGLAVHEAWNVLDARQLAASYRRVYGADGADGLPEIAHPAEDAFPFDGRASDFAIHDDVLVAAPIWHDWAKAIVFQWNADGSELAELSFGGNGRTDDRGAPGDSRTGAHHVLGLAEAMKRGLPADVVVAQASAHASPTPVNEHKVVNWLRAAAIVAQIDPVAAGYLRRDASGALRLPALRGLGTLDLNAAVPSQTNLLVEYAIQNLADADFVLGGPAMTEVQALLVTLAPRFGYDPHDAAAFTTKFRNPSLTFLTAERLAAVYARAGLEGVAAEIEKLRRRGVL